MNINNTTSVFSNCTNLVNCEGNATTVINCIDSFEVLYNIIEEKGGIDAVALTLLAKKVEEDLKKIKKLRQLKRLKKNGTFTKISNHLAKHGWFYAGIMQLIGTVVIGL